MLASERLKLKQHGTELDCSQEEWRGFPLQIKWNCQKLSLSAAAKSLTASANDVTIQANAYNPFKIMATVIGPSKLGLPHRQPLTITHDPADASLNLTTQKIANFSAHIPKPVINNQISADVIDVNFYPDQQLIKGKFSAQNLSLSPPRAQQNLHFQNLSVAANLPVTLALAPDIIATAAQTSAPLTIEKISFTEGDTDFNLQGQLYLNPQHQLNGELTATTHNVKALLNFLSKPLRLSANEIATAQTMLMFAGGTDKDGTTEIKLTISSGQVRWGEMKLAQLPPLN